MTPQQAQLCAFPSCNETGTDSRLFHNREQDGPCEQQAVCPTHAAMYDYIIAEGWLIVGPDDRYWPCQCEQERRRQNAVPANATA